MNRHPNQKTAVVWTKKDDPASLLAISALKRAGVKVEQRVVDGRNYKTADLQAAVPGATRLPQIVVNDQVVGDIAALKAHPEFAPKTARMPKKMTAEEKTARTAKVVEKRAAKKAEKATARAARVNAALSAKQAPNADQAKAARQTHVAARAANIKAQRAQARAARG